MEAILYRNFILFYRQALSSFQVLYGLKIKFFDKFHYEAIPTVRVC